MKLKRVLQYAQHLLEIAIEAGDIAVDATAGNGHDTLYLANLVGDHGKVFAFDVQQEAVQATTKRLEAENLLHRTKVIHSGHENILTYISQPVAAAIFNLGYLPGSNHEIVTQSHTTIKAVQQLLSLLKIGGIIVLVVYHGHEGGKEEKNALVEYVSSLPQKYVHVLRYEFMNQQNDPPFIIALEKVKELPTSET